MNKFVIKLSSSTLLAVFIGIISAPSSFSQRKYVTPPKTSCFIYVGDAHISTSIFRKERRRAIKINAHSECDVPQKSVVLTIKIFKKGFGPPHLVVQKSTKADNPRSQGLIVKNQFTFAYCKNETKSEFYGIAFSSALINGKRFTAPPVWSENTVELKCGT